MSERSGTAKLTQEEATATAARHDILFSGWAGGARADFAFTDIGGLELMGCNLEEADFSGAKMEEINLAGAQLDGARFVGADLRRANLTGARLRRADLRGACLRGANLIGADLTGADLRAYPGDAANRDPERPSISPAPVEMSSALMVSANLVHARLDGVMAVEVDFTDAAMADCTLTGANLRQCSFTGAWLTRADFTRSTIMGAVFRDAILTDACFTDTFTTDSDLTGALTDLPSGATSGKTPEALATQIAAHQRWVASAGTSGMPADFTGQDLRGIRIARFARLDGLIAPRSILCGLDLSGISLSGCDLEGADLRATILARADLRGANLCGAKLNFADLHGALLGPLLTETDKLIPTRLDAAAARYVDLSEADLRRASLAACDLSYAALAGADLRNANYTEADLTGVRFLPAHIETSAAPG